MLGDAATTAAGVNSGNGQLVLGSVGHPLYTKNTVGAASGTTHDINMGTGAVILGGNRQVTVGTGSNVGTLTVGGVIYDGIWVGPEEAARLLDAAGVPTAPILATLPSGLLLDLKWRSNLVPLPQSRASPP